jgi:hypothetical protein
MAFASSGNSKQLAVSIAGHAKRSAGLYRKAQSIPAPAAGGTLAHEPLATSGCAAGLFTNSRT